MVHFGLFYASFAKFSILKFPINAKDLITLDLNLSIYRKTSLPLYPRQGLFDPVSGNKLQERRRTKLPRQRDEKRYRNMRLVN